MLNVATDQLDIPAFLRVENRPELSSDQQRRLAARVRAQAAAKARKDPERLARKQKEAAEERRRARLARNQERQEQRAALFAGQKEQLNRAVRIATQSLLGPSFIEDADGRRIRVWGNPNEDWVTKDDVRAWLRNVRVVEDLRDGLEFVRESYIKTMIKEGYLRKDARAPFYWVTAKAAEYFGLEKVMGCEFPK